MKTVPFLALALTLAAAGSALRFAPAAICAPPPASTPAPAAAAPRAAVPGKPAPTPPAPLAFSIDFTPHVATVAFEEGPARALYLQNGQSRIYLKTPPNWSVDGNSTQLTLSPLDRAQARAELHNSPLVLPNQINAKWAEENHARLAKTLPKESQNLEWLTDVTQPININGWRSYECTVSYDLFGSRYQKSFCYVQLNPAHGLELVCLAQAGDFNSLHQAATRMLVSWRMPSAGELAQLTR